MLTVMRKALHSDLLSQVLSVDASGIPTNADKDSVQSVRLAQRIAEKLKVEPGRERLAGQTSGNKFEAVVEKFLRSTFLNLEHLRPGIWRIEKVNSRGNKIASFEQYGHLEELAKLARTSRQLAAALGSDYVVAPDVIILRLPEQDELINRPQEIVDKESALLSPLRAVNGGMPLLHASISCKWTLRSDRAQNAKSEALNMIRNRKGHLPHIVAVTGEPLPSRIASLALGTGDIDCVYHFALPELEQALAETGDETGADMLRTMVVGKRLKDISDLPLDLAI